MRVYNHYFAQNRLYVNSPDSDLCAEYYRRNLITYDLVFFSREQNRLYDQLVRKAKKRLEAELKTARLRKEEKQIRKKLRALSDRESQNILKLKIDEKANSSFFFIDKVIDFFQISSPFFFPEYLNILIKGFLETSSTPQGSLGANQASKCFYYRKILSI